MTTHAHNRDTFGSVPANVATPGDGEIIEQGPVRISIPLRAEHGAGFAMMELSSPPGFRAPQVPHWHTREHCVFYVVEGTISMTLAQGTIEASAGTMVHLPPGSPFVWSNPGDRPARFLGIWCPAGFETFFGEVGDRLDELGAQPTPPVMARVIPPLWQKYAIEVAADRD